MAVRTIGKLKFNFSERGLAFKWGEGRAHLISLPFRREDSAEEEEEASAGRYGDPYRRREPEDPYGDRGGYSRDSYAPRGTQRDLYETDDDPDGYYGEDYDEDYESSSPFMRYVDEQDWVTLALLVLLPPLGIYLLWRRMRYSQAMRVGLSAAATIWFLLVLFWLIPLIFRGTPDVTATTTQQTSFKLTTVAPTAAPAVPDATTSQGGADESTGSSVSSGDSSASQAAATPAPATSSQTAAPVVTPVPGASTGATEFVYSPSTGSYYHAVINCPEIPDGITTTRVAVSAAQSRGQSPCPSCYSGELYYVTTNGTHYHSDPNCSNMVNPYTMTKSAAEALGKTACPTCILTPEEALFSSAYVESTYAGILTGVTEDKSGIKVWCTANGVNYHTREDCRGMSGAREISLLGAIQNGKTPCDTCCASAGVMVYCTKDGTYYHGNSTCSGMTGASLVTYAEALVLGKQRCPTCLKNAASYKNSEAAEEAANSKSASGIFVYATTDGKYYHTDEHCSGMNGAKKVALEIMVAAGRPACPVCAASANTVVYANKNGTYYHSKPTCQDMTDAPATTLAQALVDGKKKCPHCWNDTDGTRSSTADLKLDTPAPGGF